MARKSVHKPQTLSQLLFSSITLGVLTFVWLSLPPREQTHLVSSFAPPEQSVTIDNTQLPPTQIRFPTLSLSLPIQASQIQDGVWQVFDTTAAWLSTSKVPGGGNVIVYAHNKPKLFGKLDQLNVADQIHVLQGSDWKVYQVTQIQIVSPDDINAVISNQDQLTLYTCEGTFDQKRLVVYARPLQSLL